MTTQTAHIPAWSPTACAFNKACRRFALGELGGAYVVADTEAGGAIAAGSPVSLDHHAVIAWAVAYNAAQARIGYAGAATRADAARHWGAA